MTSLATSCRVRARARNPVADTKQNLGCDGNYAGDFRAPPFKLSHLPVDESVACSTGFIAVFGVRLNGSRAHRRTRARAAAAPVNLDKAILCRDKDCNAKDELSTKGELCV